MDINAFMEDVQKLTESLHSLKANQITGQIEASNLRAAARLFDYFREQDNNTKCALLEQKVEGEDENADPQGSRKTPELRADKYVALMLESFEKNNQLALLLSSASEQEILEADSPADLFRGETFAARLLSAALFNTEGITYLRTVLLGLIEKIVGSSDADLELDLNGTNKPDKVASNLKSILEKIKKFFKKLHSCIIVCPIHLRQSLLVINKEITKKFPNLSGGQSTAAILFLHYFNPAIISPRKFNLCKDQPSPTQQRALVVVSRIIQATANGTGISSVSNFQALNTQVAEFVKKQTPVVREYVSKLMNESEIKKLEKVVATKRVPFAERNAALQNVLTFLGEEVRRLDRSSTISKKSTPSQGSHLVRRSLSLDELDLFDEDNEPLNHVERQSSGSNDEDEADEAGDIPTPLPVPRSSPQTIIMKHRNESSSSQKRSKAASGSKFSRPNNRLDFAPASLPHKPSLADIRERHSHGETKYSRPTEQPSNIVRPTIVPRRKRSNSTEQPTLLLSGSEESISSEDVRTPSQLELVARPRAASGSRSKSRDSIDSSGIPIPLPISRDNRRRSSSELAPVLNDTKHSHSSSHTSASNTSLHTHTSHSGSRRDKRPKLSRGSKDLHLKHTSLTKENDDSVLDADRRPSLSGDDHSKVSSLPRTAR